MIYKYGEWKKSALLTLQRLKEENDKGQKPKASFFRNGSITAWLAIFKEHGEVINGDGYMISDKGITLLEQLKRESFKVARGPRNRDLSSYAAQANKDTAFNAGSELKESFYHIDLTGPNGLRITLNLKKPSALKIIKILTEIK